MTTEGTRGCRDTTAYLELAATGTHKPLVSPLDLHLKLAPTALFFYDYLLTFAQEIKCIWARKPTGASFLFALNRYAVFVGRSVRLVQLMSWHGFLEKDADLVRLYSLCLPLRWS